MDRILLGCRRPINDHRDGSIKPSGELGGPPTFTRMWRDHRSERLARSTSTTSITG
ncbi:MAG TPA: hypothetical protein VGJ32_01375 [Solirubrobacteraceae bacterium]